jgi:hypothetical protein
MRHRRTQGKMKVRATFLTIHMRKTFPEKVTPERVFRNKWDFSR